MSIFSVSGFGCETSFSAQEISDFLVGLSINSRQRRNALRELRRWANPNGAVEIEPYAAHQIARLQTGISVHDMSAGFAARVLAEMLRRNPLRVAALVERWIQIPSREYQKADGTRGFLPIVEFSTAERRQAFNRAALIALHALLETTGGR